MIALRLPMLAVALVAVAPVVAQTTPSPAELQAGLVGKWSGALGYRDYQSNKLFELPVRTEITALPDKATVLRVSVFDDGPATGLVHITSASLYDAAKGTVSTTTLRKGRTVETASDSVTVLRFTDAQHWEVRYERDGTDDDKPARVRITETRDGNRVTSVKEVMPRAAEAKGWQFRNRTRLERLVP